MRKWNRIFRKLFFSILYWSVAMYAFFLFRYYGLNEENGIIIDSSNINFHTPSQWVVSSAIGGVVLGFFYFLMGIIIDTKRFRRKSLGVILLSTVFLFFITLVVGGNLVVGIVESIYEVNAMDGLLVFQPFFWSFALYFLLMSFIFSFVDMVSEKFGKGVLANMLMGKYRVPQEEERIFLFLDLKSSTTIAEKLGHVDYSRLIQQCFYDLNEIVQIYEGEIYQYVGDEAVVSWPYHKGTEHNRCINCFFAFQDLLKSKSVYYNDKFSEIPEFKAGLHGGKLIVTEVGVMKKEIAYHGDVINTASRIQGECNKYDEKLLVSEILSNDLNADRYLFQKLGKVDLKGKKLPVVICAVNKVA